MLSHYQLYLFDFDGLLVNTEELHYHAYKEMMRERGIDFTWDFKRYCQSAHYTSDLFRKEIFVDFPLLEKQDPTWELLYKEKQSIIQRLFKESSPNLMPGVEELLKKLQNNTIPHCVVTHSPHELVQNLRNIYPVLDAIPHWITRNDYTFPKPDSECYQLAIKRYSKPGDRVVGFEDTPRGLTSLMGTKADAFLVTNVPYPEIEYFVNKGAKVIESLLDVDISLAP